MSIEPDTKDWTWVVERPCPECGYDARSVDRADIPAQIRATAATVAAHAHETQRPDDSTWSPLEYACHVRDVCALYAARLDMMLTQDDPLYPNWDQDATAEQDRYSEQDPAEVADQVTSAAGRMATELALVTGDQWSRPGRRSDGASFTIDTFARYLLHDLVHHTWDVTGVQADA